MDALAFGPWQLNCLRIVQFIQLHAFNISQGQTKLNFDLLQFMKWPGVTHTPTYSILIQPVTSSLHLITQAFITLVANHTYSNYFVEDEFLPLNMI